MEAAVTEATPAVAIEPIPANGEARLEWQRTGKLPEAKKEPSKAESTPAKEEPPASEEGTASASEAESTQEHKSTEKRSNAETRKAQLTAEIQELLKTRNELKREVETPKAESSPASVAEKVESKEPIEPLLDDFDNWDKYNEAHRQWVKNFAKYEAQNAIQQYEEKKAQEKSFAEWQSKVAEARTRYPDYDDTIAPACSDIMDNRDTHPAVRAMIDASPVMADLLYVMGKKPDDLARLAKLSKTNPIEAIREIVLLDALVREERSGKAKEEVKVPAKRVPTAPDPGYEASGTATSPGDVVQEAVKKGDYATFAAEQNRRDIARRKGR